MNVPRDRGRPAALAGEPPRTIDELTRGADDTTWAALAYASFLMGQFVIPVVLMILAREKSEYARFHTAQALVVQVVMMIGMMLYVVLFMAVWIVSFASMATAADGQPEPPAFTGAMLVIFPIHFLVIFGILAVNLGCGIGGLVQTLRGRSFRIPLVGKWVFRRFFLGKRAASAAGGVAVASARSDGGPSP